MQSYSEFFYALNPNPHVIFLTEEFIFPLSFPSIHRIFRFFCKYSKHIKKGEYLYFRGAGVTLITRKESSDDSAETTRKCCSGNDK